MLPANAGAGVPPARPVSILTIVALTLGGLLLAVLGVTSLVVMLANAERVHAAEMAKVAIALTAAFLSLIDALVVALRRSVPNPVKIVFGVLLAGAAVTAYFDGFSFSYPNYYHRWDMYHGFLGSKYYPELGAYKLYRCTLVAQDELGTVTVPGSDGSPVTVDMTAEARASTRKIRDLERSRILAPASIALENPEACKDAFEEERWDAFKRDVAFFRGQAGRRYFEDMQTDHGYKASPMWTVGARLVTGLHAPTVGYMKLLSFLDLAFLLGVFGALWWAFGWRVSATGAIFWGCQACSTFYWTGGAFMRHEWLFFLVLSVCLLRRHHAKLAGASLAYAALLSGFPALVGVGWVLFGVVQSIRTRRLPREVKGALLGAALCLAVAVPASVLATSSSAWEATWETHVTDATPVTNDMGLGVVLSHGYGDEPGVGRMKYSKDTSLFDPFANWRKMREERYDAMLPGLVVIVLAVALAFGLAMWRVRSMWIAGALGQVFIVLLTQMVCWNYPFLVLGAALTRLRRWLEVLLFAFAAVTQLAAVGFYYIDDRYTAMSIVTTLFTVLLVVLLVRVRLTPAKRVRARQETEDPGQAW